MEAQQLFLIACFDQLADQGRGGGEADAMATLTGSQTESQCDVRLAGAGVAKQQHVLFSEQELAAGQLQDHSLVERGHGKEVEAVQAFGDRELRLSDAAFGGASFAVQQLQLRHAQQVAGIVDIFDRALSCDAIVLPPQRRRPVRRGPRYSRSMVGRRNVFR